MARTAPQPGLAQGCARGKLNGRRSDLSIGYNRARSDRRCSIVCAQIWQPATRRWGANAAKSAAAYSLWLTTVLQIARENESWHRGYE
jgi:hypothetical protein